MRKKLYIYESNDFRTRLQRSHQNYISRETLLLIEDKFCRFCTGKKIFTRGIAIKWDGVICLINFQLKWRKNRSRIAQYKGVNMKTTEIARYRKKVHLNLTSPIPEGDHDDD